ncbi:MAG: hypothetical protein J3Q66DRAFT_179887 [Benniella sp.]|nr:MAG: hypothetical protein J3Q66DRAFT_179887 [Benniella sp.]
MDLARSFLQPVAKAALAPPATPTRHKVPTTTSNHFLSLLFFHESNSWPTATLVDDEQLKNFQLLKRTFASILAGLVRDRSHRQLVLLCPVQQSLIGSDALSKQEWEWGGIDEEFIMSHIVRVPDRDCPLTKGLSVNTLNGKSLIVTDTTVTTAKGFKILKQARLLSEQVFYDNEGRGWIIQYIDRPLVGMPQEDTSINIGSTPGSPEVNRYENERFATISNHSPQPESQHASRTSRGSRFRSNHYHAVGVGATHRDTRKRPKSQPTLNFSIVLQRFSGISSRLEQLIMKFNDQAMTKSDLDDIRATVDSLLTDGVDLFNQADPSALTALLDEYGATFEDLDQLLESHIMNSTYDIVFFKITAQMKQNDWDLVEAMRELQNLDLGQVGLPETQQHYQCLVSGLNEFQSMGILRTPREKLECLVRTVRVASTLSGGADVLIPILLLTVLRSGISNLASNIYYMKNFLLFGDSSRGEYGYSLSTLEAVSRYIPSHSKQLSPLSKRNQTYWEKVCTGDLEGIKEIYATTSERNEVPSLTQPPPSLLRTQSAVSLESFSDVSVGSGVLNTSSASQLRSRDGEGNDAVLLACKSQQMDVLRYLLEVQSNSIDISNYEGRTPLMVSVDVENVEMIKLVLQIIATRDRSVLDKQDVLGNTAVHVCVSKGNSTILGELLKADADLGLPNNEGDTPLIIAAKLHNTDEKYGEIVSMLASAMKVDDLNRKNNSGDTALHFITDPILIGNLASYGANPEIENYSGWTPLLKWTLHDNVPVVQGLLDTNRVDTLITDSRGYTPLHMACLRGNLEMVKMLQVHTPIDLQSTIDGSTPLQLACQSGSASVVDFLLRSGANPQLRDWSNESPADMTNDAAILEMLDNAMLFWDRKNDRPMAKIVAASVDTKGNGKADNGKAVSSSAGKRVIRVVRGTMEQDGKVRYIVKSGSTLDPSTIVTMPRTLEEFQFLRENLLVEGPDACIPSLEGFYPPYLLSPSRPSKTVLSISARRLDMFLNYLSNHPVLANHELVWEFMLMPELQQDVILERSRTKQLNAIDSIFDNFPRTIENLENEETYFKHFKDEILNLDAAIQQVKRCARKLSRSAQDVPQQLEIFAEVLGRSHEISFGNKGDHLQAMRAIASTQTTMHLSDIDSLGNLLKIFHS